MKYYLHTFGCQMNENDSQLMAGLLQSAGYQAAASAEQAEVIIVNTCCVRQNAENRALGYLGSIKKLYDDGPARVIVVCGCMMQQPGVAELLSKSYRHIGIIIGTFAGARLPEYIAEYLATGRRIVDIEERYGSEELTRSERAQINGDYRAQVNINYGCNNFCSYCIVPYVRGRERSRRPEEIITEVEQLVSQGVREVQLLGQNVNSYGRDLPHGQDFAALLELVNSVEGLGRIRFMTSHPRDFTPELAEKIFQLDKVCRHFHLPLQSGSNRLLHEMNRGYTTEHYQGLLETLRNLFPQAAITTDLIVGFPGETEEDFQKSVDFVASCEFDSAYTFLYSKRSGTPAALMPNQVVDTVKKQRLQRLMDVQNQISLAKNCKLIGQTLPVMVEGISKNDCERMCGRTDGNKIVIFPKHDFLKPGNIIDLRITAAQTWNIIAE